MKRIMMILGMMLAAACGGELGDYEPEFETAEQDVNFIATYGFRNDLPDSNTRCDSGTQVNSHSCNYPPNKTLTVRCTGTGMTAAQKTVCEQKLDGFIAAFSAELPTWSMSRINSGTADVNISYGTNSSTNAKTSIHRYAKATVSNPTLLDDFGSTGSYFKYGSINCTVDRARIVVDTTMLQQDKVLTHAIHFCAHKGLGFGAGGHFNRSHSIVVTPDTYKSENLSPLNVCMAQTYDPTGNTVFPICGLEFFPPCLCSGAADN
jgi:hypothetical protein